MLIKPSAIIAEARGKCGGAVFSRNTYGAYVRTKVTPTNPSTSNQQSVRSQLTEISQYWRQLTDAQRSAWESLAKEVSRTNIFGDSVAYTAFNLFQVVNRNLQTIGEAIIDDAPSIEAIESVTSLTLTAAAGTPALSLAFVPSPVPTGFKMVIYATPQISAGISFVKSEYRKLKVVDAAGTSPSNLLSDYVAKFGALVAGKRIFVAAKLVSKTSGMASLQLQTSAVVAS